MDLSNECKIKIVITTFLDRCILFYYLYYYDGRIMLMPGRNLHILWAIRDVRQRLAIILMPNNLLTIETFK